MKSRLLTVFLVLLLLFIVLSLKIDWGSLNYKQTKKIDSELLSLCGLDPIPKNIIVKDNLLRIGEGELLKDTWQKYEHESFSVLYPKDRRLYGEETGFNLCPIGHCQDAEMFISEYSDGECGNIGYVLRVNKNIKDDYHLVIWTNFKIGQYHGLALTITPINPIETDPLSGISGIVEANSQKYEFGANFDEVQLNILGSFEPKK